MFVLGPRSGSRMVGVRVCVCGVSGPRSCEFTSHWAYARTHRSCSDEIPQRDAATGDRVRVGVRNLGGDLLGHRLLDLSKIHVVLVLGGGLGLDGGFLLRRENILAVEDVILIQNQDFVGISMKF